MQTNRCPIFQVADTIGKKWTIVIIQEVSLNGKKGFNAILQRMGKISPKVLSSRLKDLEQKGVIAKKIVTDKMPVRTSYTLTTKGKELHEIITLLKIWNNKYDKTNLECDKTECVNCPLY